MTSPLLRGTTIVRDERGAGAMLAAAVANEVYKQHQLVLRTSADRNESTGITNLIYYYGGMGFIKQTVSIAAGDDLEFWLGFADNMARDVYQVWLKNSRPQEKDEPN